MAYVAVAIGGFLGACLRYGISEWVGTFGGFPISTMSINILGSFFLAWFYTVTSRYVMINPYVRLGIGTGFVGAFTTFSTFTADTWKLLAAGFPVSSIWYLILSLVIGLIAAYLGFALGEWQYQKRVVHE